MIKTTASAIACTVWLFAVPTVQGQRAAWYSFDDGTAADVSGNGHDGTIFGAPVLVPSAVVRGLRFDGVNDQIVVPDDIELQLKTLTISLWVKVDQLPVRTQWLVGKEEGASGYRLLLLNGGAVEFQMRLKRIMLG